MCSGHPQGATEPTGQVWGFKYSLLPLSKCLVSKQLQSHMHIWDTWTHTWAVTPSHCWSQCCRQHSRQSLAFLALGPNGSPKLAKKWSREGNQTPRWKAEVQPHNRCTSFSSPVTLQQCVSFFTQWESGTWAYTQLVLTGARRHVREMLPMCVCVCMQPGRWTTASMVHAIPLHSVRIFLCQAVFACRAVTIFLEASCLSVIWLGRWLDFL